MAQVQVSGMSEHSQSHEYEGWTCSKCGMWVQNGTTHICYLSQPSWYPCIGCVLYQRIDMLLEKLTKLIEVMENGRK